MLRNIMRQLRATLQLAFDLAISILRVSLWDKHYGNAFTSKPCLDLQLVNSLQKLCLLHC